jgi:hypothetical protein
LATRTFRGTINSNYSLAANWAELATPTSSDDVVFDGSSPNCTIDTASVAKTLTCTNYTNTLTFTFGLTVSGNITLGASMGFSGSATLATNASATLKSNGVTCTVPLYIAQVSTSTTTTITSTWTNTGLVTIGQSNAAVNLNSGTLNCNGGLSCPGSSTVTGTTLIVIGGTGTITTTAVLKNSFTIQAGSGTVTFSGNFVYTGTLTYASGTIVFSSSSLNIQGSSILDTSGMTWASIIVGVANSVLTLNSTLNVTTLSSAVNFSVSGSYGISATTINITAAITMTINSSITVTTLNLPNAAFTTAGSGTLNITDLRFTAYTATRIITLSNSGTVNITGSYVTNGTTSSIRQTIKSSVNVFKATLTLAYGATQFIGYTDPTDIDSSQGQQIFTYQGSITTTNNWSNGNAPLAIVKVIQASGSY